MKSLSLLAEIALFPSLPDQVSHVPENTEAVHIEMLESGDAVELRSECVDTPLVLQCLVMFLCFLVDPDQRKYVKIYHLCSAVKK